MITINRLFANALIAAMDAKQISVEGLAELCSVSRTTVSTYRSGGLPSDDTMLQLMEHLDAPWLGYIYLRENKVGASLLPEVPIRELSSSYCDLQVEMDDTGAVQKEIARICRDNRVDEQELPVWNRCTKELTELVRSAFSLLLVPIKEKAAIKAVK